MLNDWMTVIGSPALNSDDLFRIWVELNTEFPETIVVSAVATACPVLKVTGGSLSSSSRFPGTQVTVTCDPTFSYNSSQSYVVTQCRNDGTWTVNPIECQLTSKEALECSHNIPTWLLEQLVTKCQVGKEPRLLVAYNSPIITLSSELQVLDVNGLWHWG